MTKGRKIVRLKWLHTSDMHANLFGCDYRNGMRYVGGGLSDIYSYICDLKKESNNQFIITDGGDCLQGQPLAYYYNFVDTKSPHLIAEVMNEMGYACGVMGNHDIETGEETFERWKHDCKFPILGANVIDKRTGRPYVKPYIVVECSGIKIAILGLVTTAIKYYQPSSLWPHLWFEDMLPSAKQWVHTILQNENPDMLVGLFHSGFDCGFIADDENAVKNIAEQVPGFDMICYGHDHVPAVHVVKNIKGDDVVCMSAASTSGYFAEADINIVIANSQCILKSINATVLNTHTLCSDNHLLRKKYKAQIQKVTLWGDLPLCTLLETIDEREAFFGESLFVDFIHQYQLDMTYADISLVAPYSYNARLKKGKLLNKDLYPLLAYEEFIFTLQLSGLKIKEILELSYGEWVYSINEHKNQLLRIYNYSANCSKYKRLKRISKQILFHGCVSPFWRFESSVNTMFSAAGIKYDVDLMKPIGSRINILSMTDGTPFSVDKEYRVAVSRRLLCNRGGLLYKAGLSTEDVHKSIKERSEKALTYYMMHKMQEQRNVTIYRNGWWHFVPEEIISPILSRDKELLFPSNIISEMVNIFCK